MILSPRPDGSLGLAVAGTPVVCRPSGALWLEAEGTLAVADLHLEKGSSYACRGQMLPPYDTRETLDRLEAEIALLAPRQVVLLGDTFHDPGAECRLAGVERDRLILIAQARTLIWVSGNHDRIGPHGLPGEVTLSLQAMGLDLVHEPRVGAVRAEIAGHLHPCAKLRGGGAMSRRRCFVTDGERLILPAFGALAGGLNVCDPAVSDLLGRRRLALALGAGRVLPLAWSLLARN